MYLEKDTKYYEIIKDKNKIYIRYGKIQNNYKSLPIGKSIYYTFKNSDEANKFYLKKLEEKRKKNYENIKKNKTYDFKWTFKNKKFLRKTLKNK